MLRPLFRCILRLVLLPGLISLVLLCVLYNLADSKFNEWYFAHDNVWKPAFPSSWRVLFLSLFVVPAFALLHLLWLSVALTWQWCRHRYHPYSSPSQQYIMLPRNESEFLEENDENCASADSSRLHLPLQRQAPSHPVSSNWFLQFILWLAILCMSLWLTLHYQHPGDLRYLPQIEKANAHPNRAGYANQEKIFITAMFYNNEPIIPYWSNSLIKAIHYLGEDNVFVSILESGSEDRISGASPTAR
ncbi:hypothetical protein J3R82DRAFT_6828 [Butyriboletus roseoflavus]|nr:hypothetical protein J3R82DRAFT_6828 [Butyriboletus roseoflavus]